MDDRDASSGTPLLPLAQPAMGLPADPSPSLRTPNSHGTVKGYIANSISGATAGSDAGADLGALA